jgi:hypothetical protein
MEDDTCLSILAFLMSNLCNGFITHLPLVVHMFAQWFYTLQKKLSMDYIE